MKRIMRQHGGRADAGIAIVAAMAVVMLVGILSLVLIAVAVNEAEDTGRDRQRSSAVADAEGTVDLLAAQIQGTPVSSLPCSDAGTTTVGSDSLSVSATVTYLAPDGSTPVTCAAAKAGTAIGYAAIKATSSATNVMLGSSEAERVVETLVRLTPNYPNDLDKAIFGNSGVTFANNADVYGQGGAANADVYTNGNISCVNSGHFWGSIYAQGTVFLANPCVVEVDVEAKMGFTASNHPRVNGRILSSNGSINVDKMDLGQYAQVNSPNSITSGAGGPCTPASANKCRVAPAGSVTPPPVISFPILNWNATTQAEWVANGYTNIETFPRSGFPCGMYNGPAINGKNLNGSVDGTAAWLAAYGETLPANTIIVSNCPSQPVKTQNNVGIRVNKNLAIFSTGGFNFAGNTDITSTGTADINIYLIQPYDSVSTHPCTSVDGISLDNSVTVAANVNMLLYSPCNIRKANNTTYFGQIYAGGVAKVDNRLTMYFKPVPIFGLAAGGTNVESYSVQMMYKRENR